MEAITLRCRLCPATFDDPSQLQDIFRGGSEEHLGCKLRECTGVYVSPSDPLTTICTGCRQTVYFIDEFRARCRQSDRNLERLVTKGTTARAESYLYHVGELRKLLEPAGRHSPETVFVKTQEEAGFEWEEVNIKQEAVESDEDEEVIYEVQDDEEDEEEDGPKRKRTRIEWEIDPLVLAKAIHQYPVLWNAKHEGHHQTHLRDRAWDSLASATKLDKAQLRKRWCKLNDMFHKKRWGTEGQDVELYQLLNVMFSSNARRRSKFELTDETRAAIAKIIDEDSGDDRMNLAQMFYQREAIWNKTHPDFDKQSKWTTFANQLHTTADQLKRYWKCFKDIYYARRRRLLVGEIKPNHQCIQDPLYQLLEKMWFGNARSSQRIPIQTPAPEECYPLPEIDRNQFTQLIYAREVIWNQTHPDHPDVAKREQAFNEVARLLNVSNKQLKCHWRKLRSFYNNRYFRERRGQMNPDNPLLHEPIYLLLKRIFGDSDRDSCFS